MGDKTFVNDVFVEGNFEVTGIIVENVRIEDNIVTLNQGESGNGISLGTAGIEIDRGTGNSGLLVLAENVSGDGSDNRWILDIGDGTSHSILYDNFPDDAHFNANVCLSSLNASLSGNFLTWDQNGCLVDSGQSDGDFVSLNKTESISGDKTFVDMTIFEEEIILENVTSAPSSQPDSITLYSIDDNGFSRPAIKTNQVEEFFLDRDNFFIGRNVTGSTIPQYSLVYVTGQTGNTPEIDLAKADNISTLPADGITVDEIENNEFGRIMSRGIIDGIDTSSFTTGDTLFVSDSNIGDFTVTRPPHPNFVQRFAVVLTDGGLTTVA